MKADAERAAEAARKAQALLDAAQPARVDYAYVARKQIVPDGLFSIALTDAVRILGYPPKGGKKQEPLVGPTVLVVPVYVAGSLSTVELIDGDGRKSFVAGGATGGGYWTTTPLPDCDWAGDLTTIIGEGVGTVISATMATGHLGVAALSCGNLLAVGKMIRERYPDAKIVFVADLGIGEKKSTEAARAVGGCVAIPTFPEGGDGKDANDLHVVRGLPAVAACIDSATEPEQGEPVKADIGGAMPNAVPAAAVLPWPTMDNGAFYGPLGEAARLIEPLTEADSAAVLVHLLVAFGSAVGRGPRLVIGSIRQTANLFAVIVGKSSKARKGTAWANAREIICPADEAWSKDRIKSGLSSGEGVIHAVRDPVFKREPIREGGKRTGKIIDYQEVEEDAGESDKRLLVIEAEFARTLKAASRRENTLSPVLREAWDSGSLSTMTKCPYKATGAHVCIVGHITKDELKRELSACDSVNGYANRFLWCCSRRARELPFGEKRVEEAAAPAMTRIQRAVTWARARGDDFVISMDAGARELWKAGYSRLSADRPGLVGSVLGRAEAQVLRLALVYALADESGTVKRSHLEAALALWRFAENSARHIFGDALGDSVADEILRVLRESPEGMTREEIGDHFNRHTPAPRLTEALRLLAENALATFAREPARGGCGRPAERWFAVSPSREESEVSEVSDTRLGTSLASFASRAPAGEANSPTTRTAATNNQGETDAEEDAV